MKREEKTVQSFSAFDFLHEHSSSSFSELSFEEVLVKIKQNRIFDECDFPSKIFVFLRWKYIFNWWKTRVNLILFEGSFFGSFFWFSCLLENNWKNSAVAFSSFWMQSHKSLYNNITISISIRKILYHFEKILFIFRRDKRGNKKKTSNLHFISKHKREPAASAKWMNLSIKFIIFVSFTMKIYRLWFAELERKNNIFRAHVQMAINKKKNVF